LSALQSALTVPVVGAVEPGARTAHATSVSGHIGVIGTLGTIRSGAYEAALRTLNHGAVVTGQPCALFVPLAEEGWTGGEIAHLVAMRYLSELAARDPRIDTLVLGCTHYPLLSEVIAHAAEAAFAHPVTMVDSATAMAHTARTVLVEKKLLRGPGTGRLRCYVTDASRLDELAPRFLGEPLEHVETADL
jgi:glutamate racemase